MEEREWVGLVGGEKRRGTTAEEEKGERVWMGKGEGEDKERKRWKALISKRMPMLV